MPRVLIADDYAPGLDLLVQICKSLGIPEDRIVRASDGGEAKSQIMRDFGDPFDLLITDDNMPVMKGTELVSWLAQREKPRVILMSGAIPIFEPDYRLPDVFVFVKKPPNFKLMARLIAVLIEA